MAVLCSQDLHDGQTFVSPDVVMTEADLLAYATEFDPQPMHIDPEAAAHGPFGGLIASGWHTACVALRLQREAGLPSLALAEIENLTWPRPVRPGERIHAQIEIRATLPDPVNAEQDLVQFQNTVINDLGETVLVMLGTISMPRRPTLTPSD